MTHTRSWRASLLIFSQMPPSYGLSAGPENSMLQQLESGLTEGHGHRFVQPPTTAQTPRRKAAKWLRCCLASLRLRVLAFQPGRWTNRWWWPPTRTESGPRQAQVTRRTQSPNAVTHRAPASSKDTAAGSKAAGSKAPPTHSR